MKIREFAQEGHGPEGMPCYEKRHPQLLGDEPISSMLLRIGRLRRSPETSGSSAMTQWGFWATSVVWILLFSFLFATPGLPYSILWVGGVGEPLQQVTARGMGMGGVSIAIAYHTAELNPACMSLDKTSIALTGVQEVIYSSGGGAHATSYDFRLPGLCIAFPLPWEVAVDARYTQNISADFALCGEDTISGEPYLHELSRDGSITNVSLGLRKRFYPVTIGLRGCMDFGSFLDEQRIDFQSADYTDSYDRLIREFNGFSYRIGILYRLAGLSVGGFYRTRSELGSDLTLPPSYGVGTSYSVGRTLIGLDYTTSLWSQTDEHYDNARAVGIGCEYRVGHSKLRAGYRYSSSYYHQIREHAVTAGIGFPLRKQSGGIELAVEMGMRGDSDQPGLEEKLVRFGFTFWGLEKWERRTSYP